MHDTHSYKSSAATPELRHAGAQLLSCGRGRRPGRSTSPPFNILPTRRRPRLRSAGRIGKALADLGDSPGAGCHWNRFSQTDRCVRGSSTAASCVSSNKRRSSAAMRPGQRRPVRPVTSMAASCISSHTGLMHKRRSSSSLHPGHPQPVHQATSMAASCNSSHRRRSSSAMHPGTNDQLIK